MKRSRDKFRFAAAGLTVFIATACDQQPPTQKGTTEKGTKFLFADKFLFSDVGEAVGLRFRHESGADGEFLFPEIMGAGGAWIDIDNDGDLDAYLIQGGSLRAAPATRPPNRMYRNDDGQFTDITDDSGADDRGYGMGACVGDVDNDGDNDLYVTNVGPNVLLLNDGKGHFTKDPAAGVDDAGWGTSCAFLDYDRDGDLDLFLTNYVRWSVEREKKCYEITGIQDYCSPTSYNASAPDVLYQNNGDGTFTDVTQASGVGAAFGNGLGVVCGDFNDDGWVDIYVANDQTPNNLWLNQRDGTFREEALLAGVAVNAIGMPEASMGVDAFDVDRDGRSDLFMTHLQGETHTLYLGTGPGRFLDHTVRTAFNLWSHSATGFGTAFFDYDHDGLADLFVANGHVLLGAGFQRPEHNAYAQANQLIRQHAPGKFEDVSIAGGAGIVAEHVSRGAMFGDYDNDGDVDILVTNNNDACQLLRNDAPKTGDWLMVRATTGTPPRDAIGTVIRLTMADGGVYRREIRPAAGYCGSNDPRAHFAFAENAEPASMTIQWPNGEQETLAPPRPLNRLMTYHR